MQRFYQNVFQNEFALVYFSVVKSVKYGRSSKVILQYASDPERSRITKCTCPIQWRQAVVAGPERYIPQEETTMAVPLTDKEIEDLREVFNLFDVNKDGEHISCRLSVQCKSRKL